MRMTAGPRFQITGRNNESNSPSQLQFKLRFECSRKRSHRWIVDMHGHAICDLCGCPGCSQTSERLLKIATRRVPREFPDADAIDQAQECDATRLHEARQIAGQRLQIFDTIQRAEVGERSVEWGVTG